MRAGTLIRWFRMVAVRALAWNIDASAPAARVSLNAIAARTSQAPLALNYFEGKCARTLSFKSAMICSITAWARWDFSASSIGSGLSVNTAW